MTKKKWSKGAVGSATSEPNKKRRRSDTKTRHSGKPDTGDGGAIVFVDVEMFDASDTRFMFRTSLRTAELEDSVRRHGIRQPLLARPAPEGGLQLVSGFRRLNAAINAGLGQVPVRIKNLTDDEADLESLIENEERHSYSDVDRARIIAHLERQGWNQERIAQELSISPRQVRNSKRLLKMPEVARIAVDEGNLTTSHAIALAQAAKRDPELDWSKWIADVAEHHWTVPRLKRELASPYPRRPAAPRDELLACNEEAESVERPPPPFYSLIGRVLTIRHGTYAPRKMAAEDLTALVKEVTSLLSWLEEHQRRARRKKAARRLKNPALRRKMAARWRPSR